MWPLWYLGGVLWATRLVAPDVVVWYPPVDISDTQLASGWLNQVWTSSERICAIIASNTPSCHLFHYQDGLCSLSDVNVSYSTMKTLSISQPPSPPTTTCRTRYDRVCFTDVGVFSEGETYLLECKNATCSNGVSVYTASAVAACSAPFTGVTGVGCVYMTSTNMTWCDARVHCTDLGGDLYVPTNFTALQYYLVPFAYKNVWVGVRNRKWLNGNTVTTAEWASNSPNDPTIYTCSRMVPRGSLYNLDDTNCFNASFVSLCQRQVPGM